MSLSHADFWKLIVDSRLLTTPQCETLAAEFGGVKGAQQSNTKVLAEWLVVRQALSRYQATVLLAGRPGPFYYGDYRVHDRVEQGTFKGRFRAVHAPTGHPVMLRFLAGSVLKDNREWALIAARVQKQAGVVYPLLQRYFEPVDLQAFRFVVSEDVPGETLDELLARHGRMPPPEAARIIRLVAFALSYLHQLGQPHGDVRPGQIVYEASGQIKLLVDPTQLPGPLNVAQMDPASPAAMKVDYAAPDFLQANKTPDALTDIYALGCTFYHLLTGQPPFPGGTPGQKLARHAAEPIQPLEPYGVPHPLAQLVAFMMAKNPSVRTAQAATIGEQLAPYVDPSRLQIPALPAPATLAPYEAWIRQKQAVLTNVEKVKASAPAGPVINVATASPGKPAAGQGGVVAAPAASTAARLTGRKSRRQQMPLFVGGGVAAVALLVLVLFIANSGGDEDPGAGKVARHGTVTDPDPTPTINVPDAIMPPITDPMTPAPPPGGTLTSLPAGPTETLVARYDVRPDDGNLLWASPTTGNPVEMTNVPPNAQIFLVARPAELLASPHGEKVLEALGPTFAAQRDQWERAAGVKLADVRQVVLAWHDNAGKMPRPSYRVLLETAVPENELVTRWGNPARRETSGDSYYEGGGRAYYVPPAGGGGIFVMGDPQEIKDLATAKGAPPVLRREVDQLRRLSDNDRHFTLLLAPNYIFSDGRELFTGPFQKMLQPIDWFLGDEIKAAMTSMHFEGNYYVELRLISDISREKNKLAADLRDRLAEIPNHIENYIVSLNPPTYWKKVANRYPGMIYLLHRHTRIGVEDDVAMVNAVAPGALAHNLIFGGELALLSTPGAVVASAGGPAAPAAPQTLDEVLKHKITFEVPRNDMNLAMADLEKEIRTDLPGLPFEFAIKILGKDLELEGITRNQAIVDFKMSGAPLAEVLTGLVRKGNPVTTVQDPSEVDQKLVWVIGPDPDRPDKQVVLITTRAACATKNYKLAAPFVK